MRVTRIKWWCWLGHENDPTARSCAKCGAARVTKHAQVHTSERSVVYYNPATGQHVTPARADQPVPDVYARQGFERREILNMTAWEKEANVCHEPSTFNNGNEPVPGDSSDPVVRGKVKEALVEDMREAFASGPWTGGEDIV